MAPRTGPIVVMFCMSLLTSSPACPDWEMRSDVTAFMALLNLSISSAPSATNGPNFLMMVAEVVGVPSESVDSFGSLSFRVFDISEKI